MRKLKLQMQITADGFVAGPDGQLDWMTPFFVNPVAIGRGMRVFKDRKSLRLTGSTAYPSGIVVNSYEPA